MKRADLQNHITDDLGNDVEMPCRFGQEYDALCAVAEAADTEHREHCLLLTSHCPICQALADLDQVRQSNRRFNPN